MKKSELKELLKPMIKECIKEVIFEDGVLSNIVSEVAGGLSRPTLVEAKKSTDTPPQHNQAYLKEQQDAIESHKRELLASINQDAYGGVNVFEGTSPLTSGGSISQGPTTKGPLSDVDPNDPGVDISNIMGLAGGRWSAHMK